MTAPLSRRHFLGAALAGLTLAPGATAFAAEPEVAVIGAGAAGIAAARALIEAGVPTVVLEAKPRVGGRAFTDRDSFPLPFDRGCSWLHQSDRQPLTGLARQAGYTLMLHEENNEALFHQGRRITADQEDTYSLIWQRSLHALEELGESGRDIAPDASLPQMPPWSDVMRAWLGPLSVGADVTDFSVLDWWSLEETTPNLMIREGYGTLVESLAQDLPMWLSTPVLGIDWGGAGVGIDTPKGRLNVKAAIVTVSTGVLAAERIFFDPPLPLEKLQAIEALPMGLLAKVPLLFDGARFDLDANAWLSYTADSERLCYFFTWPFDSDLMIGFVGGRFGWELSAAGRDAAIDFALGEIAKVLGEDARRHFVKGDFTAWAEDPDILGGYAYGRSGSKGARTALAAPLAERLFFAGEATAGGLAMTCGGAYLSGQRAAREVLAVLPR